MWIVKRKREYLYWDGDDYYWGPEFRFAVRFEDQDCAERSAGDMCGKAFEVNVHHYVVVKDGVFLGPPFDGDGGSAGATWAEGRFAWRLKPEEAFVFSKTNALRFAAQFCGSIERLAGSTGD